MGGGAPARPPVHEPAAVGPAGAARWAGYLEWLREEVIGAVLALGPEEQRHARVPSGWSPLEMLSHLLHMERRWIVWGFLGEPVADPWGDWNVVDPGLAGGGGAAARWAVGADDTAEDLAERLRALGERTRGVLLAEPPEAHARVGGRFPEAPPTLEWICFHVLVEYARHAGHLDISTELSRG